jgi:four helix bundle protein
MGTIRTFRDLVAYQRARALSNAVHNFTRGLPQHVQFEIASQLRRAASSVRLNIAEGFGVGTNPGMLRHLRIARGSLFETDAALEQIADIGLGQPSPEILDLVQETDRVFQGLIRSLERKASRPTS